MWLWNKEVCLAYPDVAEGLALYDIYVANGDKVGLLTAAIAAEAGEKHPFAAALRAAGERLGIVPPTAARQYHAGYGISVSLGADAYFFGNAKGMRRLSVQIPYAVRHADLLGCAVLYAVRNAEFFGVFLFRPAASAEAKTLVRRLHSVGKSCVLLGGGRAADLLARSLGIRRFSCEKDLQERKKRAKIKMIGGEEIPLLCKALALPERICSRLRADIPLEDTDMFGKVNYTMQIKGMSCAHCSARVKTALESLRGVSADVSLEEKTARIKCPASMDAEKLAAAVTEVGFTVVSVERV